ncbi:NAD(P)-dependent dehydrogenase, short-chain alcohol dehydrogenase family [Novosphingobium sp. CF614]|uniref:SDR family NAD(P)-dependent oxidoreductase n=1 Tax=Novosphingobium sp. CF614 TaxID=1884364 RepID=UPI0008E8C805|nr:SDR family NAD(P)-dependent oxidoreductase [Novosphingobium sp. CF614]SFG01099.1 NAD(P)-dependent dehydrogenase, short-chain alcohol dehydrogenase family [Novosphingobium sp. CF614]
MRELRFDGQVAIVTGAGGNPGLGRAHAMLLASRGARVVVNDLGVGSDGTGREKSNAEAVVQEIRDAGGEAVASLDSVADEESAKRIVQTALDAWGRLDILVNNAGIGCVAGFDEIRTADIHRLIDVHLMGHIWMSRAAWAPMVRAGYGRIVNTTSGAMFGMDGLTVYAAAKFGIYGLTRGLANEGAAHGIKVNALSPGAATRSGPRFFKMNDPAMQEAYDARFKPELVSSAIAFLAHESCSVTGMLLDSAGGHVSARLIAATPGIEHADLTPEHVRDGLARIFAEDDLKIVAHPGSTTEVGGKKASSLMVALPYEPG